MTSEELKNLTNLKSSLDRFIAYFSRRVSFVETDLKSSLDRFIAVNSSCSLASFSI